MGDSGQIESVADDDEMISVSAARSVVYNIVFCRHGVLVAVTSLQRSALAETLQSFVQNHI